VISKSTCRSLKMSVLIIGQVKTMNLSTGICVTLVIWMEILVLALSAYGSVTLVIMSLMQRNQVSSVTALLIVVNARYTILTDNLMVKPSPMLNNLSNLVKEVVDLERVRLDFHPFKVKIPSLV
jgi:hypothetical protein